MVTQGSTTDTLGIRAPEDYEDWRDEFLALLSAAEGGPIFTAPDRTALNNKITEFRNQAGVDDTADDGEIIGFATSEGVFYISDGTWTFPDTESNKINVSTSITDLVDSADTTLLEDSTNSIDDLSDLFVSLHEDETKQGTLTLEDNLLMTAANILLQGNRLETGTDGSIDASDGELILPTQ